MGFWDRLFGRSFEPAQYVQHPPFEPFVSTGGRMVADPGTPIEEYLVNAHHSGVEKFWRTQPNLRKVVDFIARNVASVPLNAFERVSDVKRRRLVSEPLADLMRSPRPGVAPYRFWRDVLSDGLLYDRWVVLQTADDDANPSLLRIPARQTWIKLDALGQVENIMWWNGEEWRKLPMELAIFDFGFAPSSAGLSPVETLRDVLSEGAEAIRWRRELWQNGTRAPGYIHRPLDAKWDDTARNRFVESLRAQFGRDGTRPGGLPLLEDGMEIRKMDIFSPRDMTDVEVRQLSAVEVAAAFHVPPELVGAREGTYSNVDAFRQMLWSTALGPYIDAWQGALNAQLVPRFAEGRPVYVEANIDSKLRGSFLEQAQVMQSATGAPWLTRNEVRAMQNRAPIEGGDELVVPLNVLVGGQASPRDSGDQNRRSAPGLAIKSRAPENYETKARDVVARFFARQEQVLRSELGAKSPEWWDEDRWNSELADDLFRLALLVSKQVGRDVLESIGFDPDLYDPDRTLQWLREVAKRSARSINKATRQRIEEALAHVGDPEPLDAVFEERETRAESVAMELITLLSAFAAVEAAKHAGIEGTATKTWVSSGRNPRAAHAAMSGETVGISEVFSNGARWPGDAAALGAEDLAYCQCYLRINP